MVREDNILCMKNLHDLKRQTIEERHKPCFIVSIEREELLSGQERRKAYSGHEDKRGKLENF